MSKEHLQVFYPKYLENRFLKDTIDNTTTIVLTHALNKQLPKNLRSSTSPSCCYLFTPGSVAFSSVPAPAHGSSGLSPASFGAGRGEAQG